MNRSSLVSRVSGAALMAAWAAVSVPGYAQDAAAPDAEENPAITVIGTYLGAGEPQNAASPVTVLTREELVNSGEIDLTAAVFDMPVNQGSESQPNIFHQNFSAGTAQFNLRGLGLGSTLVLVDGGRVVTSASAAQDGSTFVDINTVPKIAVERVEVLKDGAAALYGSDAVAGVVNYSLRKRVKGAELTGSYQTTYDGKQDEYEIAGIAGTAIGSFEVVGAVNYFRRNPLQAMDRAFTHGTGYSRSGQPGNYILLPTNAVNPPAPLNPPLTPDPACEAGNGVTDPGPTNHCLYDFIPANQLVIPEERLQFYGSLSGDVAPGVKLDINAVYSRGRVLGQTLPPSLPATGGIVPATHPNNPFGFDAVCICRPFASNSPPGVIFRKNDTFRMAAGLEGELGSAWTWKLGAQYSDNLYTYNYPDTRLDRFYAALRGQGGPNNNEYFNPFGRSQGNSPTVLADIAANASRVGKTGLFTADALVTGGFDIGLAGGDLGIALGAQYRRERLTADFDPITNNFELAYLGGAKDFTGSRNIVGAFTEVSLPFTERLEAKLAARFERYDLAGSTVDPKFAVRYEPVDGLVLRGSYSTTFRAPSLLQTYGYQGAVAEIQPGQFRTVLFTPNANLRNETANVLNLRGVWEKDGLFGGSDHFFVSVDYWSFSYSDVITGVNPVQMVTDFTAALNAGRATHNNLNTSAAFRNFVLAGGTGVFSRNNTIAGVISPFVNAASLKTSGIDVEMNYAFDIGQARVSLKSAATRTLKYDLVPFAGAPKIDGLDQRNFFNFGRPNSDFRATGDIGVKLGAHSFGFGARYVDGYHDEVNNAPIRAHTEFDAHYMVDIDSWGTTLTVGATNLFDRDPPFVKTFFGYDSKQADPRGGMVFIRLSQKFGN